MADKGQRRAERMKEFTDEIILTIDLLEALLKYEAVSLYWRARVLVRRDILKDTLATITKPTTEKGEVK